MSDLGLEKSVVRSFYENVGWLEVDSSRLYMDACYFEDLRPVTANYRAHANGRVRQALPREGDLILDVASGPIQYDDYLQFSQGFRKRVCVDLSMRALLGARRRIGNQGLYVQGDITRLPFRTDVFDAGVSLHTIYHVPADEQSDAVKELHRTLKPDRRAVIVYKWHPSLLKTLLALPYVLTDRIKQAILNVPGARPTIQRFRSARGRFDGESDSENTSRHDLPPLYFFAHDLKWFKHAVGKFSPLEVRCWRSLEVPMLKRIPENERGRHLLTFMQWLEDRFPHFFGRIGSYPLIVITKEGKSPKILQDFLSNG